MRDVVIVGYGPVGATAANFLGQAGLDVVVVERDPSPYPRARAISTDEDVLRCWQHVGLADELKAEMLGDRPIDFVDDRGRSFMSFAPKPRDNGHPPQMFIYQPALERTLRRGVDRFPNVEVLLEHEAGRVRQDGEGVELDVTDLRDGTTKILRSRYVLACDGGSSPIRTQLSIGFEGRTYEDPWLVIDANVKKEWPEVDRLRFHCDPERPAVDCPTPLGHHRWEFPVLPGEDRDELKSEASVWRLLARYGITDEHVEVLRRVVYVHHVRFADRWRDGRVFLLGDAAHVMPPWIGQGMASGVRDADNLCWKIAAVVRGKASPALLDSYEPERKPHVRKMTRAALFFGRVITERRRQLTSVRDVGFRALMRTPFAGSYLRDGKWAAMPDYSPGLVDRRSGSKLVGPRLPQPFVVDHDGHRVRLDDLIAGGWTLLVRTEALERTATVRMEWEDAGARTFVLVEHLPQSAGELRDEDGSLAAALRAHAVDAVVLRPDVFVYAAATPGHGLPEPPALLLDLSAPAPAGLGASAGERLLAAAAARLDDRQLERVLGHGPALTGIFSEMAKAFVPRVANGFLGEVQYDLCRSSGRVHSFTVRIAGYTAHARRGSAKQPAITLRMGVADFLRVAAGQIDQVDLLKARRIDISGDGLLAARMGSMFGRAAPADLYVAPPAIDPPPPIVQDLQEA
jgi:3-(3-hydroxy-phenyl)propionate hydroxylase